MSDDSSVARRLLAIVTAAAALPSGGCLAYHVVAAPVKVAADAVVITGETASAAVKTTGKVTVSAINAVGRIGSGGIDAAAQLTETGMITFVDVGTGTVTRVPWRQGATLASAGADAKLELVRRSIDVIRAGAVVYSGKQLAGSGAPLVSGDVVRVRG